MIRCILFDLDGTLVDAADWHYEALNRALGVYAIDYEEHLKRFNGKPTRIKLEMLTAERGLPPYMHDDISRNKQKYTVEVIEEKCKPDFRLIGIFKLLREDGFSLGVCSNAVRSTVNLMLEKLELDGLVDLRLSNQDVKKAKPAPDIYCLAMAALHAGPQHTLIIEDSEVGLESARASGAYVMQVSRPDDVTLERIYRITAGGKDAEYSDAAGRKGAAV